MQRREFVAGAVASTTVMVAGCGVFGGDGSNGPGGAVEDYYDAFNNTDTEAFDDILHSDSPLRPLRDAGGGEAELQIDVTGTEVTDDDPGEEAIRSEWGGDATLYTEEDLQTMVDISGGAEDAAIVDAELETSVQDQTETGTQTHLTATESGEWTFVV